VSGQRPIQGKWPNLSSRSGAMYLSVRRSVRKQQPEENVFLSVKSTEEMINAVLLVHPLALLRLLLSSSVPISASSTVTTLSAASSVLKNVARLIEMEGMMKAARDIKTFVTVTFLHLNVLLNVSELTIKDETMNLAKITPTSVIVTSHPHLHQSVLANVVGLIMKDEMMKVARITRLFLTVIDHLLQLLLLVAPQHAVIHIREELLTLAVNNTKTSIGIALFLNLWWWNLNART